MCRCLLNFDRSQKPPLIHMPFAVAKCKPFVAADEISSWPSPIGAIFITKPLTKVVQAISPQTMRLAAFYNYLCSSASSVEHGVGNGCYGCGCKQHIRLAGRG